MITARNGVENDGARYGEVLGIKKAPGVNLSA